MWYYIMDLMNELSTAMDVDFEAPEWPLQLEEDKMGLLGVGTGVNDHFGAAATSS